MAKIKSCIYLCLVFFLLTGCSEQIVNEETKRNTDITTEQEFRYEYDNSNNGTTVTDFEQIIEEIQLDNSLVKTLQLEEYARLIEQTIIRERFLHGHIFTSMEEGNVDTEIYLSSESGKIYFKSTNTNEVYSLSKSVLYENYELQSERELNLCEEIGIVFLGNHLVNFDIIGLYELPLLTEQDRDIIALLCDEIYKQFSRRKEGFTYYIYLGSYDNAFYENVNYVSAYMAVIGDEEYFIYADMTEKNGENDIWMFPSPFGLVDSLASGQNHNIIYRESIDNIVSLGECVAVLSK